MNRQDRRRAQRDARRGRLYAVPLPPLGLPNGVDCDCTPRLLVPLGEMRCPECDEPSVLALTGPMVMHTMAEPGDVTTLNVGCRCGGDYEVLCGVEAA